MARRVLVGTMTIQRALLSDGARRQRARVGTSVDRLTCPRDRGKQAKLRGNASRLAVVVAAIITCCQRGPNRLLIGYCTADKDRLVGIICLCHQFAVHGRWQGTNCQIVPRLHPLPSIPPHPIATPHTHTRRTRIYLPRLPSFFKSSPGPTIAHGAPIACKSARSGFTSYNTS